MNNNWLEISDILNTFDVSESTLRRLIKKNKNNPDCIRKNKNRYLFNYSKLVKLFKTSQNYSKEQKDEQNDQSNELKGEELNRSIDNIYDYFERQKETNYIVKHHQNIIDELIHQRQERSIYRTALFWVFLGFLFLFISIIIISYYVFNAYKLELISNYNAEIKEARQGVLEQKKENQEIKFQYKTMISDIKSSYDLFFKAQETQIVEQQKQIFELRSKFEQVKQQHNPTNKGTLVH